MWELNLQTTCELILLIRVRYHFGDTQKGRPRINNIILSSYFTHLCYHKHGIGINELVEPEGDLREGRSTVRNFGNTILRYQVTQKDPYVGRVFTWSNFLVGVWSPKNGNQKLSSITLISHQQSIDNRFLSSHKKFQPNWQNMAKKCMPIYGMIGIFREILAHNLKF